MTENRELTMDDYLAMLRRRIRVIVIPALLAPIAGFAVSFAFSPKYTSQSLVLVEEPKVSGTYVKPVQTEDLSSRVATLEQRALSTENLRPLIEQLGLAPAGAVDGVVDNIRDNVSINAVMATTVGNAQAGKKTALPACVVAEFRILLLYEYPMSLEAVQRRVN